MKLTDELAGNVFRVYPNPAADKLVIDIPE